MENQIQNEIKTREKKKSLSQFDVTSISTIDPALNLSIQVPSHSSSWEKLLTCDNSAEKTNSERGRRDRKKVAIP